MNPKHTGKGYGDKLQLEEIDDDTMVQAPLDLDLPARDVFQEDIPPAQDMLDHGENPLPVMDNPVQQQDEDDLAITEENEDLPVMDNSVRQGDEDDLAITEENEQEEKCTHRNCPLYLVDTRLESIVNRPNSRMAICSRCFIFFCRGG